MLFRSDSKRLRVTPSQKVVTYCEAAFRRAPNPQKRLPKGSWSPEAKKCQVLLATHTLGSRFLEAPQITKKALLQYIPGWREPGAARKDGENIRGTCCALGCVGGSLAEAQRGQRYPERPREAQRASERPRPKGGQFYQLLTYWEAAFLKGPKSRKKASKRLLVAPSQKVASFISNSHIGKPLF